MGLRERSVRLIPELTKLEKIRYEFEELAGTLMYAIISITNRRLDPPTHPNTACGYKRQTLWIISWKQSSHKSDWTVL
jgi:hypothetical protein